MSNTSQDAALVVPRGYLLRDEIFTMRDRLMRLFPHFTRQQAWSTALSMVALSRRA